MPYKLAETLRAYLQPSGNSQESSPGTVLTLQIIGAIPSTSSRTGWPKSSRR